MPEPEPLAEPTGLAALEDEVAHPWGVLDLLDVLQNADFRTGFTEEFPSVAIAASGNVRPVDNGV
ncbi:hypothetical protein ABZ686_03875 [Streptomyces sp. NPDC006992]|uniref:hypothetical protein n=1 Tax=unclassified Streptomyces TaxID=2593676 RepID=UPI0033EC82F2